LSLPGPGERPTDEASAVEGIGSEDRAAGSEGSAQGPRPGSPEGPRPGSTEPEGPGSPHAPAGPPGGSIFTIEGRAAPGLFVLGWLATILGGGILLVGLASAGAAAIVLLSIGLLLLFVGLVSGAGSQGLERRARGVAGYAGPSPILVFLAVIPGTLLLEVAVGAPLAAAGIDPSSPLAALIGLLLTAFAYIALVRLLVVGPGALSWLDMGVRPPGGQQLTELVIGGLMAFPLLVITGLLAAVLGTFLSTPEPTLPTSGGTAGMLVNLISAAVIAPIAEEIFFRGFSTTAWLRSLGADQAILRGALFFAAAHVLTVGGETFTLGLEHALFAFVARLPVALALGWVFVRSRSLYASIGLHSVFNALPVIAYLFLSS
jgi:membrane protease YdiL (CAAX protease family)